MPAEPVRAAGYEKAAGGACGFFRSGCWAFLVISSPNPSLDLEVVSFGGN
jgi:hypothetical protein